MAVSATDKNGRCEATIDRMDFFPMKEVNFIEENQKKVGDG